MSVLPSPEYQRTEPCLDKSDGTNWDREHQQCRIHPLVDKDNDDGKKCNSKDDDKEHSPERPVHTDQLATGVTIHV